MDFQTDVKTKKSPRLDSKEMPPSPLTDAADRPESTSNLGASTVAARSKTLPPPPEWAICQALQLTDLQVSWLAGDGSDRCYYRISHPPSQRTFVLMQLSGDDAIQLQQDGYEWVKIGKLLHESGIYAPQTIATLPDFAALIIEDYGDIMMETRAIQALAHHRRPEALDLYRRAFEILGRFLQITKAGSSHWRQRTFDAERFNWELHFFREQFVEGVLNWTFTAAESQAFSSDAAKLAGFLASSSHYFVHRDFHSRNVMVKDDKLAVIDFQDARLGPPTYDLVSLCFDSYIPLTPLERRLLVGEGIAALHHHAPQVSKQSLEDEWGPMLLQRQLKALGSFGFLTIKKNRGNYLRYVSPALDTLSADFVVDPRWAFISQGLLAGVRERWALKSEEV